MWSKIQCFGSGSESPWIRHDVGLLYPDPGGKKWPKNLEKSEEIYSFEVFSSKSWKASQVQQFGRLLLKPRDKYSAIFEIKKYVIF